MHYHATILHSSAQGSEGAQVYSIVGAVGVVGTAYVFTSYQGLLYITLQFQCAYAFSTEPSFAAKRVQISVWDEDLTGQVAEVPYQVRALEVKVREGGGSGKGRVQARVEGEG